MAADQERAVGRPAEREPLVAGGVDRLLEREALELPPQPLARARPRVRPRDALGAVLVARELLQLAELGHGPRRLERHAEEPSRGPALARP